MVPSQALITRSHWRLDEANGALRHRKHISSGRMNTVNDLNIVYEKMQYGTGDGE